MISFLQKFINTFFFKFFFNPIIKIFFLKNKIQKLLLNKNKLRWEASDDINFSSVLHYTQLPKDGPEIELLNEIKKICKFDDKILDLGSNCGRFSNNLFESGFKDLHAVDISHKAKKKMKEVFPNLYKNVNFSVSSFDDFFHKIPDNYYDIVFTMGATIDLIHPIYDIASQVSRVSSKYLILQLQEKGQPYIRFWDFEFKLNNFERINKNNNCFPNFNLRIYKKL